MISNTSSRCRRSLTRRMNSTLSGHHGASGRTEVAYRRIASWASGWSNAIGNVTSRAGSTTVVGIGQPGGQEREPLGQFVQPQPRRVDRDQDRPHTLDDLGHAVRPVAPQRLRQQVDPHPDGQVELGRSGFHQQMAFARAADRVRRACRASDRCRTSGRAGLLTGDDDRPPAPGGDRSARDAVRRIASVAAAIVTGTSWTESPARSWPSIHRSASITTAGTTKPPSDGPSLPTITGVSPDSMMPPTGYAESCTLDGCRPASPPSVRAQPGIGPTSLIPVRSERWSTIQLLAKNSSTPSP